MPVAASIDRCREKIPRQITLRRQRDGWMNIKAIDDLKTNYLPDERLA
jgi:hypothetical protein